MDSPSTNNDAPLRDPSKLFFQKDSLRRSIVASYWILILLALPLWWYTTSIERLSLPSNRIQQQARNRLQLPITICIESNDAGLIRQADQELSNRITQYRQRWKGLDVRVVAVAASSCGSGSDVYMVTPKSGSPTIEKRTLFFPLDEARAPSRLADTLTSLLVPYTDLSDLEHRVAQYSPRYRLAFSLLNEDATAGDAVLGWNIQQALKSYVNPVLRRLGPLHNFTIESQVQFHAPLGFTPWQLESVYAINPADLTVFVNSADWTLSSSSSNDPVLHFILFIPSAQRRPLRILDNDETLTQSNAFILPQWGGIVIFNPEKPINGDLPLKDLNVVFSSFARQMHGLLGVPQLPSDVGHSGGASVISDWQLDALLRRRTLENEAASQDTLLSIIKLVDKIENMPVKEDVRGDVEGALNALTKMRDSSGKSLKETFTHSAQSFGLASRAFFSPGMIALLYFPAEHTYAVYTPLFASTVIPLFVAALRETKAWRRERHAASATT
ncbi:unnamed protein product [Cyclocybe aegerita]|uniref:GPI transamidase component PIG-S n=1 Tax=Cyclocybe aegerita TaxID=1973307 RepID=A0A8S0W663_CYCAE|nr:unnamed protein product [Cyclocybe aegerita]